jgi:hypothetical protein
MRAKIRDLIALVVDIFQSKIIHIFAIILLLYAAVTVVWANPVVMNQYLNFIMVSVAAAVVFTYLPPVFAALRMGKLDRVSQLTLGIAVAWVGYLINRIWANAILVFPDHSDWMRTSPVIGFYVLLTILGGVLHLTAPGAISHSIPARNWAWVGIAFAIGFLMGSVAIATSYGRAIFF